MNILSVITVAFPQLSSLIFSENLSEVESFFKTNSLMILLTFTIFPLCFLLMSRNYLKLSKNIYYTALSSHTAIHHLRNTSNDVTLLKKSLTCFSDYSKDTNFYFKYLMHIKSLYQTTGTECLKIFNETIGDKNGVVAIKILQEEEASHLRYFLKHFDSFSEEHSLTYNPIHDLEIKVLGNPNESKSIFEYICRIINNRKEKYRPQDKGIAWGVSYISNDFQGEKIFYLPRGVEWKNYFKSGITTPITIHNEVKGFLTYSTYTIGRLRAYHAQLLAMYADLFAEILRKACPNIDHLVEEYENHKCQINCLPK